MQKLLSAFCLAMLPLASFADGTVTFQVRVDYPGANSALPYPTNGAYTAQFRQGQASITLADGTVRIFDFKKHSVVELDPKANTYFELTMDRYLDLGSNLFGRTGDQYELVSSCKISPAQGQDPRPVMGQASAPYLVESDTHGAKKTDTTPPYREARTPTGQPTNPDQAGGSYPGAPNNVNPPFDGGGLKTAGQIWLADAPLSGIDPNQLAVVECSTILPHLPGLRQFVDRVRRSSLPLMAADISVQKVDLSGHAADGPSPVISAEVTSVTADLTGSAIFSIPAGCKKVKPPMVNW